MEIGDDIPAYNLVLIARFNWRATLPLASANAHSLIALRAAVKMLSGSSATTSRT